MRVYSEVLAYFNPYEGIEQRVKDRFYNQFPTLYVSETGPLSSLPDKIKEANGHRFRNVLVWAGGDITPYQELENREMAVPDVAIMESSEESLHRLGLSVSQWREEMSITLEEERKAWELFSWRTGI